MRLPEKMVLPMPRRPGFMSFKGKNAVCACKAAARANTTGTVKRGTVTILAWKAMEPQMGTDLDRKRLYDRVTLGGGCGFPGSLSFGGIQPEMEPPIHADARG